MTGFEVKLTQEYIKQYQQASVKRKGEILDEYCRLADITQRNVAIQRFRRAGRKPYPRALAIKSKIQGRPLVFDEAHTELVKHCWQLAGGICAERLHANMNVYMDELSKAGRLASWPRDVVSRVRNISLITLKRTMKDFPTTRSKRSHQSAEILQNIPIQPRFGQFAYCLGFVGLDYVEHNGGVSNGRFVVTGTYTELSSGWTIRAAGWGKNLRSVEFIHGRATTRLLVPVRHYHSDNAPATFRVLLEHLKDPRLNYALSRSRPYRKNDNAHVEQKNGDKVRKLVGYFRLDTEAACDILNRLYEVEDLISNYFVPSAKLIRKEYDNHGKLIRKHYDTPKTPYSRLLNNPKLNNRTKRQLVGSRAGLNLVALRQESERLQDELSPHYRRMTH